MAEDIRQNVGYFDMHESLSLGNSDSQHQVFFGRMPDLADDLIAVKPFTKVARAKGEFHALQTVAERDIDTIEPLSFAVGGVASYLFTRYRPGLTNLGTVDWRVDIANPRLQHELTPAIQASALAAAGWHDKGVGHGDYQLKNSIFTLNADPVFADAERTTFHKAPAEFTPAANKDIMKLGRSMLSRGLLYDKSPSYRTGFLNETLLGAYFDALRADRYDMSPEERKQAIEAYWTEAIGKQQSVVEAKS